MTNELKPGAKLKAAVGLEAPGIAEGDTFTVTKELLETWDVGAWLLTGAVTWADGTTGMDLSPAAIPPPKDMSQVAGETKAPAPPAKPMGGVT